MTPDAPPIFEGLNDEAAQRMTALQKQIETRMEPYDAFDWLAMLFFENMVIEPDRYRESTFRGLSATVEFATCQLILRKSRAGASGERLIDGRVYNAVADAITSLLRWAALGHLPRPQESPKEIDAIRYSVLGRRLFLRHPVFEHQERRILESLFGGEFEGHLRADTGYTVADAIAICEAFRSIPLDRLRSRAELARRAAILARTGRDAPDDPQRTLREFKKLPRNFQLGAVARTWDAIGDTISLRVEDLVEATGAESTAVEAFLGHFSIGFNFELPEGADWLAGFAAGHNPVLRRPIVADGAGNYLCVGPGLLLFALRDALEELLTDRGRRELFYRWRGRFLEEEAGRILRSSLRPDRLEIGLKYEFDGVVSYIDVLAIVDTTVILVEGKAKLLSEPARRGAPKSLSRDLGEIVREGGVQADRVRKLIAERGGLMVVREDKSKEWLDLAHVTRVIPLVTTLEDVGWVAAAIEPLIQAGLVSDDQAPLVVSIHDLEIICDLVEFPAQLVQYFERRYAMNRLRAIAAVDELDYFMHYLMTGLMFDEFLKEHGALTHIFVSSLTDDLDAYYLHAEGIRSKPAKRPRQDMPKHVRRVLSKLDSSRPPGWLNGSLAVLDMNGETRAQFAKMHGLTRRKSETDRLYHDASFLFGDFGLTLMSAPDGAIFALQKRLRDYCRAKRFQQKKARWFGFGLADGPDVGSFATFVEVGPPYDAEVDLARLCQAMGLSIEG